MRMLQLPLLRLVLRTLRLLLMLARTLLLRRLLLPLLTRLLLRMLLLLRQHGWSMLDQPCCCGFSFFFAGPRRDGRDDNGCDSV